MITSIKTNFVTGLTSGDVVCYNVLITRVVWFWQVRGYLDDGWQFKYANIFRFAVEKQIERKRSIVKIVNDNTMELRNAA